MFFTFKIASAIYHPYPIKMDDVLKTPQEEPAVQDQTRKLTELKPATPLGNIALALSGGGFRAACFGLGVMNYLQRTPYGDNNLPLLNRVSFITSTSGGSILNACYTSRMIDGVAFPEFYEEMKSFMEGDKVIGEVFRLLNDPTKWKEVGAKTEGDKKVEVRKNPNLINGFAKAYDSLFFHGKTFDTYYKNTSNNKTTVCFNSTEFNNGQYFRFYNSGDASKVFMIGNYYLNFNNADVAKRLKLSDMVAASSCFPSGFEPIIYPNDFIHEGLNDVDQMLDAITYKNNNPLNQSAIYKKQFSLMDGGVVDNQGLESMMAEDDFRESQQKNRFDLMMVCDVGSYFLAPLETPLVKTTGWTTKWSINSVFKLMFWAIPLSILCILSIATGVWRSLGLLLLIPSVTFATIHIVITSWFNKKKSADAGSWSNTIFSKIDFFLALKLNVIIQMMKARLGSVVLLASDVFMKQIRKLYYGDFYRVPFYKDRTLSCFIYEFAAAHKQIRDDNLKKKDAAWYKPVQSELIPSKAIEDIATEATLMGTTLWFDPNEEKDKKRDKIIATGQFTICYNLIKHIYRMEIIKPEVKNDPKVQDLKQRLLADWTKFKKDPMWAV